ncbi:hypothetical protein HYV81_04060 [Candidatus Woesearchaeota archaeon]|nr:hypothetical protein [Candidatus Woesearchaeota archaeon]
MGNDVIDNLVSALKETWSRDTFRRGLEKERILRKSDVAAIAKVAFDSYIAGTYRTISDWYHESTGW